MRFRYFMTRSGSANNLYQCQKRARLALSVYYHIQMYYILCTFLRIWPRTLYEHSLFKLFKLLINLFRPRQHCLCTTSRDERQAELHVRLQKYRTLPFFTHYQRPYKTIESGVGQPIEVCGKNSILRNTSPFRQLCSLTAHHYNFGQGLSNLVKTPFPGLV